MKAFLPITAVLIAFLYSCGNPEERLGWHTGPAGLRYQVHSTTGDTAAPRIGSVCVLGLKYGTPDTAFIDTWKVGETAALNVRASDYPGDLFAGILQLRKGDSASFRLSADSFFLHTTGLPQLPPGVSPGDSLDVLVVLREIRTRKEHRMIMARELMERRAE